MSVDDRAALKTDVAHLLSAAAAKGDQGQIQYYRAIYMVILKVEGQAGPR